MLVICVLDGIILRVCARCSRPIDEDEEFAQALEADWHGACFRYVAHYVSPAPPDPACVTHTCVRISATKII